MKSAGTRSARRRDPARWSRGTEIVLGLALLTISLLFCELLLSVAARVSPVVEYQLSPPWTRVLTPDPVLGHRLSPYYPGHDHRGYRNSGAHERYAILAVGDSVTYGFAAAPQDSWPRQLEAISGLPTYNAGVGDYSPCEYQVVTGELLVLEPRLVLVGLYLANDLSDVYSAVYVEQRFADRRSRDPAVMAAIASEDERGTMRERAIGLGMEVRPPAAGATGSMWRWLAERSALYGLARSALHLLETRSDAPLRFVEADPFAEAASRPHRIAWDQRPRQRTVFLDPRLQALAVDLGDARIREGLRITGDVLADLRAALAGRGVDLLVVLLHSKSAVYAELLRADSPAGGRELAALLSREEDLAGAVRRRLARDGVRHVDTLPAMRAALARGEVLFPQSDDEHPAARGYRIIAETVYDALPPMP